MCDALDNNKDECGQQKCGGKALSLSHTHTHTQIDEKQSIKNINSLAAAEEAEKNNTHTKRGWSETGETEREKNEMMKDKHAPQG